MSTIQRLIYIDNARLPTEKAHGFQIVKMCEAFAQNGVHVVLMHPFRHQSDLRLKEQSIFDYYSVPPVFEVNSLPNADIVRLERLFPKSTFTPVFFAHACLWGLYAALVARHRKADLYYTRAIEVAFWLIQLGLPTVYEGHVVPKRGQKWLLQQVAHGSSLRLVVVLTSSIKERLVQLGFAAEKVIVLPDGVDLTWFENLPSKEECRRRLGLPLDRAIIGYIGRFRTLQMEKGIPELVRAMASLPPVNGSEPLLLCVGGPMDAVPAYINLASGLAILEQRLQFVDRVPNREVPFWIRACDIVTIPWPETEFSAFFTSPLKLFEYMAASVPIVASDLPSLREVLQHGKHAWLVEPGSPKALAHGILHVLYNRDLRSRIAHQAWQSAQIYSWENRALTILQYLRRILCPRKHKLLTLHS